MTDCIQNKILELSPDVNQPAVYQELKRLTQQLIKLYQSQGRLSDDPFGPARSRSISTPTDKIIPLLNDSTCVVTGGMGCIGSLLVQELLKYDVHQIIILDNSPLPYSNSGNIIRFDCDIRMLSSVNEIFALYRPDFVFHLAAQRDPGLAETTVLETTTTNVLGTLNIIQASELVGSVQQVIASSTGKASRYYTEEIYAATKKVGEFVIAEFAKKSHIKYTLIRYTHILDNSLMNRDLKEASENNPFVTVHRPGKYVTAQNGSEAVSLMMNALLCSRKKQCRFLIARQLAWPVESLEMALYHIVQSGRDIPMVFVGDPAGYSEKFFRGQLDWSKPEELNLLTNRYERKYQRLSAAGDVIISRPCMANKDVVQDVLMTISASTSEQDAAQSLITGLQDLVKASLKTVDRCETVEILRWGLDPRFLEIQKATVSDFSTLVQMLTESLAGSIYTEEVDTLLYQNA